MCLSATFGLTGWLQDTQKICRSVSSLSPSFTCIDRKETSTSVLPRSRCSWLQEVLLKKKERESVRKPWAWVHLLVLLNGLLLGLGDDAFQFVEASLHLSEAQPGVLLLPPDALQLFLTVLLSDAGTLLPLLDALRKDLIDPTVENKSYLSTGSDSNLGKGDDVSSYLAANFMPQSSEQYLEFGLEAATQPGPKHWRCPVPSRSSPFSPHLLLSLCFCFCLCRRDSFCVFTEQRQLTGPTTFSSGYYKQRRNSYFFIKLLFSSLDVFHLHGFFAQNWTQVQIIILVAKIRLHNN